MSSLGFGGLCFADEPFVTGGACVIGIVVCVVDPELGECEDVPFEETAGPFDTEREGVERGVVELLVGGENFDLADHRGDTHMSQEFPGIFRDPS